MRKHFIAAKKSILYCGTLLKLVASFLPTSFCSGVYRLESTLPSMAWRRSSYRLQRNNNVDLAKKCTPRPDLKDVIRGAGIVTKSCPRIFPRHPSDSHSPIAVDRSDAAVFLILYSIIILVAWTNERSSLGLLQTNSFNAVIRCAFKSRQVAECRFSGVSSVYRWS